MNAHAFIFMYWIFKFFEYLLKMCIQLFNAFLNKSIFNKVFNILDISLVAAEIILKLVVRWEKGEFYDNKNEEN